MEAIAFSWEAIASRLEATASRLEAITSSELEVIASRFLGWRPSLLAGRPSLVGWSPSGKRTSKTFSVAQHGGYEEALEKAKEHFYALVAKGILKASKEKTLPQRIFIVAPAVLFFQSKRKSCMGSRLFSKTGALVTQNATFETVRAVGNRKRCLCMCALQLGCRWRVPLPDVFACALWVPVLL